MVTNDVSSILNKKMEEAFFESRNYAKEYFGKYIDIAKQVYMEKYNKPMGKWSEYNLVQGLLNMEKDLSSVFGSDRVRKCITEATTTPSDIDKFIHYSFGFATAMLADNILEKFTSVQTMDKRVGEVFYMDIVRGDNKGKFNVAGSDYISALEGPRTTGNYTSEFVEIEEWGTGDGVDTTFSSNLLYTPLVGGSVRVYYTIGGTQYEAVDNGAGVINGTSITSGTINYGTGAISIVFANPPDNNTKIWSNYQYNSAIETGKVVNLTVKLRNVFLTAQRRVANLKYLFDASLMLNKEHGIDLEAELIEKGVNGIMNEIVIDCINKIYQSAPGGSDEIVFSKTPPSTNIPYIIHRQEIIGLVANGSLKIETDIRYAKPSVIIGGRDFTSLCRGLPNDVFQKADYNVTPVGPHVVGVLDGQYEVIQCLDMLDKDKIVQDKFVLLAKGDDNLLCGSIFAEFIPLTVLNPIWTQSLDVFRSAVSYQAFKIINNKFFLRGKIVA